MTDIIIHWLNDSVKLSKDIESNTFAEDFSNGFLIGEVLSKYQLQDDFDQFSQNRTSESKLNNFTRIEPILNLLGIPFDTSRARAIMTEKHGEATKLLYQLFIALNKKQKAGLTGTAMETMRPAAPAKLDYMKSLIYKERLKHLTPRQAELNLEALQNEFKQKAVKLEKTAFRLQMEEEERIEREVQKRRLDLIEKRRQAQANLAERIAKINAAKIEIMTPPARTLELINERKKSKKLNDITSTVEDIAKFETKLAAILPSKAIDQAEMSDILRRSNEQESQRNELDHLKPKSNDAYINKIRKRLNEDESARNEREKRRRKVVIEQLRAHEAQEENRREEMLVNRLMRQSQQERRIAVQLLQARHEKEIIKQNRLYREKQYEERRLREFEDALNREAELARLAKLDYIETTKRDLELHVQIAAQRAEAKYRKHYDLCSDVLSEIVDLSCKGAEYRELTENMIPAKMWREWVTLFTAGKPLYPGSNENGAQRGLTPADVLEAERQAILNEGSFQEYKDMVGEWSPPEGSAIAGPPPPNLILGHVVNRLFNMVHPPSPANPPPEFPPFPIKACILGKSFSGKTTAAHRLANGHRLRILNVDALVQEAVEAYNSHESVDVVETNAGGPGNEGEKAKKRSRTSVDKKDEQNLSSRAVLGGKMLKLLRKGKPVDDQLSVDVLIDAIRSIPEGTGWIIDGFPSTYNQAKLLEKALSGYDANTRESKDSKGSKEKTAGKPKISRLAPDPKQPPPVPEPISAVNVVILFDVPDAVCLKRSAGRTEAQISQKQYHQEFNPPPEGSITGVQSQEQVSRVADEAYDEQQVQARVTGFLDNWPKLEKWFSKFGILKKVDANLDETPLYLETENIIEDTMDRVLKRGKYEPVPEPEPIVVPETIQEPTKPPSPPPAPAQAATEEEEVRSSSRSSKKGSVKGGKDKSPGKASTDKKRAESESPKRQASAKGSEKKSSKGSGKKGKSKSPEPAPEPQVPVEPPKTPPPAPGSEQYEYVDQPIEMQLAECLVPHWETVENTYIDTSKVIFNNTRNEREKIIRYFFSIRKDFLKYLRRPDAKQDYVDQWLVEYNAVPEDMRHDEETMAELHQKVDDLKDRLWTIADERKTQAEVERQDIINDGWLDDRLGLISNLYITLMQGEVDRYQDTVQLLKDYYRGMEGQIPDEAKADFFRLALIDMPLTDKNGLPIRPVTPETKPVSPPPEEERTTPKSPKGTRSPRSTTPKGGKKRGKSAKKDEEATPATPPPVAQPGKSFNPLEKHVHWTVIPRIPLMPRRKVGAATEGEQTVATPGKLDPKKDKAAKPGVKKSTAVLPEERVESPAGSATKDPDERLIVESFENGIKALAQIISQEESLRKAAEEAEQEAALNAAADKDKNAKGDKKPAAGKKAKSRSPSPKKGGKPDKKTPAAAPVDPAPLPTQETEEEKEKKRLRTKMRDEFFAAIRLEESACKLRLELIKAVALNNLTDLKGRAEDVYKDMNDWLGSRFLKEIESVDHMAEKMRHAIESRSKINNLLILEQQDFYIAEDVKTLRTPTPPVPPPPVEVPHSDYFTIGQIMSLHTQLALVAKDGVVSVKSFIDIFNEFTSLTHGMEMLPDLWMNVQVSQLQELASMLSFDGEYINWKSFMVAICQPLMLPSNAELMNCLKLFKEMDQKNTGYVTRQQYEQIELWFSVEKLSSSVDTTEPSSYNRTENLKRILFDIFADHNENPSKLYYREMLMYFSVDPDPFEGLLRALSVKADRLVTADDSGDVPLYIDSLYGVLHHGESIGASEDNHRFTLSPEQDRSLSLEKLQTVYTELCGDYNLGLPFKTLMEHPVIQDCLNKFNRFKQADFRVIFNPSTPAADVMNGETLSTRE